MRELKRDSNLKANNLLKDYQFDRHFVQENYPIIILCISVNVVIRYHLVENILSLEELIIVDRSLNIQKTNVINFCLIYSNNFKNIIPLCMRKYVCLNGIDRNEKILQRLNHAIFFF